MDLCIRRWYRESASCDWQCYDANLEKEGLTITKEKVWSANTGRAADGNLIGDLVGIKYKLQCEWPPLSREDVAIIDAAISPAFFM